MNELRNLLNALPAQAVWRPVYAPDGTLLHPGRGKLPDIAPETLDSVDVRGKTVLDLGCNLGPYALETARRGARHVLGLDLDADVLKAANLLAKLHGFENRVEYRAADFLKQMPDARAEVGLLIDFIGKGVITKGRVDACLRALTSPGCTSLLLSLRPAYRLDAIGLPAKDLAAMYGDDFVAGGEFRLLDYVTFRLGPQWRVQTNPTTRSRELNLKTPVLCTRV